MVPGDSGLSTALLVPSAQQDASLLLQVHPQISGSRRVRTSGQQAPAVQLHN